MDAVHREATAPRRSPWKRAWPALRSLAVGLPVLLIKSSAAGPPVLDALLPAAESFGAPWIALAAAATAGSLLLSRRLADERY
jgi:hypothetical protein